MSIYLRELRDQIDKHFTLNEIKGLCFNLSVDFDNLDGGVKRAKIEALINYLVDRSQLSSLIYQLKIERPNREWGNVSRYMQIEHSKRKFSLLSKDSSKPRYIWNSYRAPFVIGGIFFAIIIVLYQDLRSSFSVISPTNRIGQTLVMNVNTQSSNEALISSSTLKLDQYRDLPDCPNETTSDANSTMTSTVPVPSLNVTSAKVESETLSLQWTYGSQLSENQRFAVRLWSVNEPEQRHSLVWVKERCFNLRTNNEAFPPGNYYYNILVVQDTHPLSSEGIDNSWEQLERTPPEIITIPDLSSNSLPSS